MLKLWHRSEEDDVFVDVILNYMFFSHEGEFCSVFYYEDFFFWKIDTINKFITWLYDDILENNICHCDIMQTFPFINRFIDNEVHAGNQINEVLARADIG